jgi:SAM-dependent methyltransferase
MNLLDILACPACHADIVRETELLRCVACGRSYPWNNGVPVMLLNPADATIGHEHELGVRPGYARWKEHVILRSLTDRHIALDFGAGRQALDDPCIIRMDLQLTPYVDLVGDAHALPFKTESIDFAFGGAVMEHVADPPQVIRELYRVVRPGGYVYADWACVFAYHGYPHHYFNATIHGIGQAFAQFRVLETGVAPFQRAAYTLRSVIATYLECFQPRTLREHWFAADLERVLWAPLDAYDRRIDPDEQFRVAAAVYALGVKQPSGNDHLLPDILMRIYERSSDLQARYPEPLNISTPDNLLLWAKTEGADREPELRAWLSAEPRFCKWFDSARPYDRGTIESWSPELLTDVDPQPGQETTLDRWFGRPVTVRLPYGWARRGLIGLLRRRTAAILRWMGLLSNRRHIIGR